MLWKVPADTATTPASSGEAAPVAVEAPVVVALQSWPYPLWPVPRTCPAAGAWAQRAKAWVSVPGVAWPPDWTMLLHDVGARLPSATAAAAALLGELPRRGTPCWGLPPSGPGALPSASPPPPGSVV